jgi:hypothetical protein
MTLQTTQVDMTSRSGAAIAGLPAWPVAAFPYEAEIAAIMPDAMLSYVQAGRSDLRSAAAPMRERDACDLSRVWTAQDNSLPTRAVTSNVLSGLPRWVGSAPVGANVGFFADLGQSLTDYTIACLARVTTGLRNNAFVNVGATGTDRVCLFSTANDYLGIQHGVADWQNSSKVVAEDEWLPMIASYRNSDKAMRVYCGSTIPVLSTTMTNSPPASSLASLMITRENLLELAGELVFAAIWTEPVHLDEDALARLVAAMNGLAAL